MKERNGCAGIFGWAVLIVLIILLNSCVKEVAAPSEMSVTQMKDVFKNGKYSQDTVIHWHRVTQPDLQMWIDKSRAVADTICGIIVRTYVGKDNCKY